VSTKMRRTIRPIGTTVVLSCLIWMYADQINLTTMTELVTLQVLPQPGTDLVVEPQEPFSGQFTITFAGPRSELENLRQDLVSGKFKPVYYVQKNEAKEEPLDKDPVEIMNALLHPEGRKTSYPAVSVQETKPARMKIFVDRKVKVNMPVMINTGMTKTTVPIVNPPEVAVSIQQSVLEEIYGTERILRLNIENDLRNRLEDREIDEDFAVPQFVMSHPVETQQKKVRVKLRILRQFKTRTFDVSQIEVLSPNEVLAKYRVEIRDPHVAITLKGPAELIDNLKPQTIVAYVKVYSDDMSRMSTTVFPRPVQLLAMEGGIKLDPDSPPPMVDIKLVELQGAAPAAPR
jgi:hypothetical protein